MSERIPLSDRPNHDAAPPTVQRRLTSALGWFFGSAMSGAGKEVYGASRLEELNRRYGRNPIPAYTQIPVGQRDKELRSPEMLRWNGLCGDILPYLNAHTVDRPHLSWLVRKGSQLYMSGMLPARRGPWRSAFDLTGSQSRPDGETGAAVLSPLLNCVRVDVAFTPEISARQAYSLYEHHRTRAVGDIMHRVVKDMQPRSIGAVAIGNPDTLHRGDYSVAMNPLYNEHVDTTELIRAIDDVDTRFRHWESMNH